MARTQREKLWLTGGVLVAVLMVLVGYFGFISSQKSQTSAVQEQINVAKLRNGELRARLANLSEQNRNLAKYQTDIQQAKLALPDTSGLPDFLRTLQAIGAASQTNVASLSVGTPSDLTAAALPQTGTHGATTGAATPSKTTSSSSGSASGAGKKVYGLSISAVVSGSTAQLNEFLNQLQTVQPRAVLITAVTEAAGTASGATTSLNLTMQAFVQPASAAEQAGLASAAQK
jgi:Tfp pilus assembly protein PilO